MCVKTNIAFMSSIFFHPQCGYQVGVHFESFDKGVLMVNLYLPDFVVSIEIAALCFCYLFGLSFNHIETAQYDSQSQLWASRISCSPTKPYTLTKLDDIYLEALVALSVPSIIDDNLAIRFFNQVPDVVNSLNFLGPDAQEVLNSLSVEDRFVVSVYQVCELLLGCLTTSDTRQDGFQFQVDVTCELVILEQESI